MGPHATHLSHPSPRRRLVCRRRRLQARRISETPAPITFGTLAPDLALGLRAHALMEQNRREEALATFQQARFEINYQPLVSALVSMTYERFVRAELLHALGRDEEALNWYRYLPSISAEDVAYLPYTHLRQAQILERQGDRENAARHYRAFLDLWRAADPEFQPTVDEAKSSLARLESAGR